jgi:hypothetical protein
MIGRIKPTPWTLDPGVAGGMRNSRVDLAQKRTNDTRFDLGCIYSGLYVRAGLGRVAWHLAVRRLGSLLYTVPVRVGQMDAKARYLAFGIVLK